MNKIRYAPEVASRPERMAKDLANAKILAEILEDEASRIRATKVSTLNAPSEGGGQCTEQSDVAMVPPEVEDDDPEPLERGSAAVDRRIEKVMADLREQGPVEINDEVTFEEKRVCVMIPSPSNDSALTCSVGCSVTRSIPCLPSSWLSHVLLLRRYN